MAARKRGEWRKSHLDNVKKLDQELTLKAVEFLRTQWLTPDDISYIREQGALDDGWWVPNHLRAGMACRNVLRENGFGEEQFKIDNLDDYWVGLVELAVDLTTLNDVPIIRCSKCNKTFGDEGVVFINSVTRLVEGEHGFGSLPERECNVCADARKSEWKIGEGRS